MIGVILNSGKGSRMEGLTDRRPKCLVELGDKRTILGRQLEILGDRGIKKIVMTTGPFEEMIKKYVKKEFADISFNFVRNKKYASTNAIYSLHLARKFITEDCLLMHGDMVFEKKIIKDILRKGEGSKVMINKEMDLPAKDFKGRVIADRVRQISVDIFDNDCYALFPIYSMKKSDMNIWMGAVDKMVKEGNVSVYAETAFNSVSEKIMLRPVYFSRELCMEVDDQNDLGIALSRLDS